MDIQHKTPSVYVQEVDAFPPSIVGVETAVPAFIGYTQTAEQSGHSVHLKPVRIGSLVEYQATFGGPFVHPFKLTDVTAEADNLKHEIQLDDKFYRLDPVKRLYLYNSLRLFYANGGADCYVVSVGTYNAPRVLQADLEAGLTAVNDLVGPTILVIPEIGLLYDPSLADDKDAGCRTIAQKMLQQCSALGDRFALLDVWGADGLSGTVNAQDLTPTIERFRRGFAGITPEARKYGAAYFPFLKTSIVDPSDAKEVSLSNLESASLSILRSALPDAELNANHPIVKNIHTLVAEKVGTLPPSAAIAGIYTLVDATRGVWNAPSNVGLTAVNGPAIEINAEVRENLTMPIDGLAVNAVCDFVGRGTLVWGTRTLDGNSNDWRYIQVRRALIYVEQSVKLALSRFVFEPNVAQTWTTVTSMISNFLRGLWSAGGLMGATPEEAYLVQCGLGSTMTTQDILQGYMNVSIKLQMVHPAEFIVLTFRQQMQGGAG